MSENQISAFMSSVSFVSCIVVFNIYPQARERSIGFRMILVLCISDFLMSVLRLLRFLVILEAEHCFFLAFANLFLAHFSLLWSAAIAIVSYMSLKRSNGMSKKQLFGYSLSITMSLTAVITLIGYLMSFKLVPMEANESHGACTTSSPLITLTENKLTFTIFEIVSKILPIIVTTTCYILINKKLKKTFGVFSAITASCSRMKWYPIVQFALYSPILIDEILRAWFGLSNPIADIAVISFLQLAGLINSTIYVFQRTKYSGPIAAKYNQGNESVYQPIRETFLV